MALPPQPTTSRRDPRDQFALLPGPLQSFLLSKSCFEDLLALYKKHQLTDQETDAVVDLIGDIDFRYRPFSDFLPALISEIKIPEARAKAFALDVAGVHFLPIMDLIEADVWNAVKSWGGDPTKFPAKKIEATKTTALALVNELVGTLQTALLPRMQERLRFVLLSRVQGVRDDVETKEMLTRAEKVGGVALPPGDALELLDQLKRKLATAQIVAEMPAAPGTVPSTQNLVPSTPPRPAPRPPASPPPAPPRPRPSLSEALPAAQKFAGPDFPSGPPQKDEEEIAAMRVELAERIPKENELTARKRTASVENIVRTSGLILEPALTERFKRIVEARLRDIRDAFETKRLLKEAVATGGLALAQEAALRASNLIEAEYRALLGQSVAEKKREAITFESETLQAITAREVIKSAAEAQAAEDRFHKIARKSKQLEEREVLLPPVTPSHTSAPLVVQPPKPSAPPRPALKPILSPASVALPRDTKPKMEDVKVVRMVAGPIDELATMSIVEFRRLSRDPREATLKIRDKIELLKEEGFERYLAAVRAWQSSEPNRAYLALTREALGASTTVPDLIREKSQAAQATLTLDEFHAILTLNGQLQL